MKITHLLAGIFMASGLALTGCQSIASTSTTTQPAKAVTIPLTDAKLQNYSWQLVSVTDLAGQKAQPDLFNNNKPLVVNFDKSGKVRFSNTCNRMWGNYMLTNDNILVSDIASTRMMCMPESKMKFDSAAPSTLQGQFKLTQGADGQPVLTVTDKNQISVFKPVAK